MEKLNLEFLRKKPVFECEGEIIITPLSPLSISNSPTGTFYKSSVIPNDKKIYGLLENIMGFHLSAEQRKKINQTIKNRNTQYYSNAFSPIINKHLKYNIIGEDEQCIEFLMDCQTILYKRDDAGHIRGSKFFDKFLLKSNKTEIVKIMDELYKTRKETGDYEEFKDEIFSKLPQYYGSLKFREYIIKKNPYVLTYKTNTELLNFLKMGLESKTGYFLGTSESHVEIKLIEK